MITLAIIFTRDNAEMIANQLDEWNTGEELIEEHEWLLNQNGKLPVLFVDEFLFEGETARVLNGVWHHSVIEARNTKFEGDLNTNTFVKVVKS